MKTPYRTFMEAREFAGTEEIVGALHAIVSLLAFEFGRDILGYVFLVLALFSFAGYLFNVVVSNRLAKFEGRLGIPDTPKETHHD